MENNQNLAETINDYKKQLMSFYEKSLTNNFTPKTDDNNNYTINNNTNDNQTMQDGSNNMSMTDDSFSKQRIQEKKELQDDNSKQQIMEKKEKDKEDNMVKIDSVQKKITQDNSMMNGYIARNNMMKYGSLTPDEQYELFKKENTALGRLMVKTYTAKRTFPVENAVVEVSKEFPTGKHVIAKGKTNESGMTETLLLPTKRKPLSLEPGESEPYTTYTVIVTHPKYVTTRINDVPVFDETMSVQSVDLVPPSVNSTGKEIIEYTAFRPNL